MATATLPVPAAATSSGTSVRYETLTKLIDKSLVESRKGFDTSAAVNECYGADASIFAAGEEGAAGSNNMLASVIDGMVEHVNDRVKEEILAVLRREKVEEKLKKVENLIENFDRAEKEEKRAEAEDRQTAQTALEDVKLPEGVSPTDIVSYHAACVMREQRSKLQAEIKDVETEIARIEDQLSQGQAFVKKRMKKIDETGKELERTADICSFVS